MCKKETVTKERGIMPSEAAADSVPPNIIELRNCYVPPPVADWMYCYVLMPWR
jgi:hypothetical protein